MRVLLGCTNSCALQQWRRSREATGSWRSVVSHSTRHPQGQGEAQDRSAGAVSHAGPFQVRVGPKLISYVIFFSHVFPAWCLDLLIKNVSEFVYHDSSIHMLYILYLQKKLYCYNFRSQLKSLKATMSITERYSHILSRSVSYLNELGDSVRVTKTFRSCRPAWLGMDRKVCTTATTSLHFKL